MELLIDTNVILDMLLKRAGYDTAVELFRNIHRLGFRACITASTVTDLFYIIYKTTHSNEETYAVMKNVFKLVSVLSVTEKDILEAFDEKWADFEDCVQYITGKNNQMNYIITANKKDYMRGELPVLTPSEGVDMLENGNY